MALRSQSRWLRCAALLILALPSLAAAQAPALDKDQIITALQAQLSEVLARDAVMRASAASQIAERDRQIVALQKQAADLKDQIAKTAAEPKQ